jgi:Domain of unknown function (DUF222)
MTVEAISSHERALADLCAALDPESIPLDDAGEVYASLARMERLVSGAKVRMASRVAQSDGWRRSGHRSAAECLARLSGTTTGAAHAELATSKHVTELPGTAGALRRGELSASQAAAIADAAAVDQSAEGRLLETARRGSLRELRDECARVRAAADPDAEARHARIRRERSLHTFCDRDGAWNLHARGPADAGAKVMAALAPFIDDVFTRARAEGRREPREAYGFDALVELASRPRQPAAQPPAKRTDPRFLALVRVDLEALRRGSVSVEETCEITGVGPVPVSVARDLLGESILHLVITRGRDVTTTVHLGRGPNAAQHIALLWAQPECSRLGCDQTWTHAEVDHRTPWTESHETALGNLDRLCKFDHRLKTHDGWALTAGTGKRPMVPPDHPLHPSNSITGGHDPPSADGPDAAAPTQSSVMNLFDN